MKLEIVTKRVNNESLVREFIQQKMQFALERIELRVNQVTIRLEDESKSTSIFDGSCKIEVDLHPRGHVHVSSQGDSAFDCVLQAIRKMEHAVKHDIDRKRRSSKIRHQNSKREFIDSLSETDASPDVSPDVGTTAMPED